MLSQHPIYLIIISTILIVLVVVESLQKDKLFRARLFFSFLILIFHILVITVYENHVINNDSYENVYTGISFFTYFIFLIQLIVTFSNGILKGKHYNLFIKGLKENELNVYIVLDNKERIKDISVSFLEELNYEKEEVFNKRFFNVVNEKVRFIKMNQRESNNKQIENYFKSFNETRKNKEKNKQDHVELEMLNFKGSNIILKLLIQPVYSFGKLKGKVVMGEKITSGALFEVEKNLRRSDEELDSLKSRFVALLEMVGKNVFLYNMDIEQLWFNHELMIKLKFNSNEMKIKDYHMLIHQDDLDKYLLAKGSITTSNPSYKATYRLLVHGSFVWIKEEGTRVYDDKKNAIIMGTIDIMNQSHYQKTGTDILDNIKTETELAVDLQRFVNEGKQFQLAIFKLENIPEINELHGRTIGNFMIANYISRIQSVFLTPSNNIYRVEGLKFAMTITEPTKMEALFQGISSSKNFLNLEMTYGAINANLEVYVGIANMYSDAVNAQDLYLNTERALNVALSKEYKRQGCYFKDIK